MHQLVSGSGPDLDVVECVESTTQTNVGKHECLRYVASSRHFFHKPMVRHHKMGARNSAFAERTGDRYQCCIGNRTLQQQATAHDPERQAHHLPTVDAIERGVRHASACRPGGISDLYLENLTKPSHRIRPIPFYANICSRSSSSCWPDQAFVKGEGAIDLFLDREAFRGLARHGSSGRFRDASDPAEGLREGLRR